MKARIYYYIGDYDDSIVLEANDTEEMIDKINAELAKRGAHYSGSEILED